MTTQRILPTTFAGPDVGLLPIAPPIDPIGAAGSLLLLDPTHPANPWAAGVPAHDSFVPNLFRDRLSTLAGTAAGLDAKVYNAGLTAGAGLVERSGKGGLHGIISPTNGTAAGVGLNLFDPDALWNYIKANPTHAYYVSLWQRTTRAATAAGNVGQMIHASNSKFIGAVLSAATFPNVRQGARSYEAGVGPKHYNVGAVPDDGIATDGATVPAQRSAFMVGNMASPNATTGRRGLAGSHIFYRAYIEDLTVSGRTYAAVDAIDRALYLAEVVNAGGRYYNDTHTDVATLP